MTKSRWQEIKAQLKKNFEIFDEYQEDLDPGEAEIVEFAGPQGKMMAKFVTRPKVLDKKTTYSNRAGSGVRVDYVYSEEDFVTYLEAFVFSEERDEWQKLEIENLF